MKLKAREKKFTIILILVTAVSLGLLFVTNIYDVIYEANYGTNVPTPNSSDSVSPQISSTPPTTHGQRQRVVVGNAKSIYILPMGNFQKAHIEEFLKEYREKLNGDFVILETWERSFVNPSRRQENSQQILYALVREHPEYAQRCLIAITDHDLYTPARPDWRFVFADRLKNDQCAVGVIATARLRIDIGVDAVSSQRLKSRVGKLLKKTVGFLLENRAVSNDLRSVMYGPVLSSNELDQMGWDY